MSSQTFDLGVEGGTLVTSVGRRRANLYVADGLVAAVTGDRLPAGELVDAGGLLVLPGMIDTHVHLMDPGAPEREDFPTGTAAAARAGVTTVIEHSHVSPIHDAAGLQAKIAYLLSRSHVDFGLAVHSVAGNVDAAVSAWRAGASFIKVFTCTTHGVAGHSPAHMSELFKAVALLDGICLVHCEEETLMDAAEQELRAARRTDGAVIHEWRLRSAEELAASTVGQLALDTGARTVIAHVSNPAVLDVVAHHRSRGAALKAESCPQYFVLLEREVDDLGPLRKFTPPARARSESELSLMWSRLAGRDIDLISSDHAPSTIQQKLEGTIWDAHFGLPGLDTTMSVLADGAYRGLISYERLVAVYSEQPARIYRLYPRKGSLNIGSDADFVLFDPNHEWHVRDEDIISKANWSPFSGRTLHGRAQATYVRGTAVAVGGEIVAQPGVGKYLAGPGLKGQN